MLSEGVVNLDEAYLAKAYKLALHVSEFSYYIVKVRNID